MPNEKFEKLNDYTLLVTTDFQDWSNEKLRRIFNFQSRQVSEIFIQSSSNATANSMTTTRFSELDSLDEVRAMHAVLSQKGGKPPAPEDLLDGPTKPALKSPALRA
ncbi:MAG TPA: hypothetical protein VEF76_11320 [Patescibacteria group bacterium]|nr:hypothetical protein [Patescibacteria group bacterium]